MKNKRYSFFNENLFYSPIALPYYSLCSLQDLCFPSFVSIGESPTIFRKSKVIVLVTALGETPTV